VLAKAVSKSVTTESPVADAPAQLNNVLIFIPLRAAPHPHGKTLGHYKFGGNDRSRKHRAPRSNSLIGLASPSRAGVAICRATICHIQNAVADC
jgi:hypothetical protein